MKEGHGDGAGMEIGDAVFPIGVHQPAFVGLDIEHARRIRRQEVAAGAQADARVQHRAQQPDRDRLPGADDDQLPVSVLRAVKGRGGEVRGTDGNEVTPFIDRKGLGRIAVRPVIENLPAGVRDGQQKVIGVGQMGGGLRKEFRVPFQDPSEFTLSVAAAAAEVFACSQDRHQRQERNPSFDSHSLLCFGRAPLPGLVRR